MTRFFEQYKKICEARGISLNGAAKEIGLPSSSVTHWKDGAVPRMKTIQKIADYFGLTTDYLMGYTDIKEKPPAETGDIRKQAEEMIARMDQDQLLEFIAMSTEKLIQK